MVVNPLVELDAAGRIRAVTVCTEPDREPFTEFYAGVLVADFPADYRAAFRQMLTARNRPLEEQLAESLPSGAATEGVLVVIAGLDYAPLRLTDASTIRLL